MDLCAALLILGALPGQEEIASQDAKKRAAAPKGPLSGLPSPMGAHVAKIRALGDDAWLDLGSPAPDPKWGKGRGRSYNSRMAFAPDLRGAFHTGEGPHGFVKPDGHYLDDVWFYDLNAHRWICVYPGTHTDTADLVVDKDGFERTRSGDLVPVAPLVHGYEMYTYDPDRKRFMLIPGPGDYQKGALTGVWKLRNARKDIHYSNEPMPWLYDVKTGKWERHPLQEPGPSIEICTHFTYIPSKKQVLYCLHGREVWFYDPATNRWSHAGSGGAQPHTYNTVSCHDTKRDRVYFGSPTRADNVPAIYDIKAQVWIDPKPKGLPAAVVQNSHAYVTEGSHLTYDTVNDVVILVAHSYGSGKEGMYVYDPTANTWTTEPKPIKGWGNSPAAFYDPLFNVHVYHVAGDGADDGVIRVYRYKNAKK